MWSLSEWEGKTSPLHVLKSDPCLFRTVNTEWYWHSNLTFSFKSSEGFLYEAGCVDATSWFKIHFCWVALLNWCDGNSETRRSWKNMRRNVKNVAHPFWILNLWPGGLLWNANSWIRSRREMREKCSFMVWKCDDACVLYRCLYPLCPIYKPFSLE